MQKTFLLRLATKAINDTMGVDGLVPSLLVFGFIPRFPIISTKLLNQTERMKALATAKAEYEAIVAKQRITTVLQHAKPTATDRVYDLGDEKLVYREEPREWVGPMTVTRAQEKIVSVRSESGYTGDFSKVHFKPYFRDMPGCDADTDFTEVLH